jgi:hypothetical protein
MRMKWVIGWDDARILEIESNSRYRKYRESAHLACLTIPISQPSLNILLPGSTSSAMRLLTHREDLYGVTDSSWSCIRFQSRVFMFYSTDGSSGKYYTSSYFFYFFALTPMHLVLLARFVAQISTSFSILVPRMCVLYHNSYCIFSCYLPLN